MSNERSESTAVEESIKPLIPNYLLRRKEDLNVLRKASEDEDFVKIEEIAHRIKGSGASYGFSDLSACAKELETAARAKDVVVVRAVIEAYAALVQKKGTEAA